MYMNNYVQNVTPEQADSIKAFLKSKNAKFDKSIHHTIWRGSIQTYQVIYYTTGKLLVQGKYTDDIIREIDKLLGNSSFDKEDYELYIPEDKYIGTDESGKGDFFGPLIIVGVQADSACRREFIDLGIKDSKKLSDRRILKLAEDIKEMAEYSIIVINPVKYNELYAKFKNLNKLLAWGHARAIENILEKSPCNYAIADKFGDERLIKNALLEKGKKITLKQMVRAEVDIVVAAASVLARAEFVKRMTDMSAKFEMVFSKGASNTVIEEAQNFADKYSKDRLNEVAKLHFKTINEIH